MTRDVLVNRDDEPQVPVSEGHAADHRPWHRGAAAGTGLAARREALTRLLRRIRRS